MYYLCTHWFLLRRHTKNALCNIIAGQQESLADYTSQAEVDLASLAEAAEQFQVMGKFAMYTLLHSNHVILLIVVMLNFECNLVSS